MTNRKNSVKLRVMSHVEERDFCFIKKQSFDVDLSSLGYFNKVTGY